MTATHNTQFVDLHNTLPYLDEEDRTYNGYGAHPTRPAPKFIRSLAAWERASEKIGKPYLDWNGPQFAAATKIYKATLNKYGLNQPGPDVPFQA